MLALVVGAFVFLFPFYYMVIGSLQREPQTDLAGAFPNPANLTLDNFADINAQVDLARTLVNSGDLHRRRPAVDARVRAAGRLRAGTAEFPRAHRALHGDAADPGPAVPALHDPALRADRAHIRPVGQLPRDDPSVRDQRDRGVHLPPVLHPIAPGAVRIRPDRRRVGVPSSSARSRSRWLGPRSSRR